MCIFISFGFFWEEKVGYFCVVIVNDMIYIFGIVGEGVDVYV